MPGLCALVYTLSLAADATNYGIVVDTPTLTLSALPTNFLLIGTSKTLTMKADSSVILQTTASSIVSFKIIVTDPCPITTIQLTFSTLATMDYTVALPALVQNFDLATDSRSVLSAHPGLCGAYTYKIVEAYTWATVSAAANPGSISVFTTSIPLCNTYTATFEVGLASYPAVPKIQIPFTINILNPCFDTVLSFPVPPADYTITALLDTVPFD